MATSSRVTLIFVAALLFHFLPLEARKLAVMEKGLRTFHGESVDLSKTTDRVLQSVTSPGIGDYRVLQSVPSPGNGHYEVWRPVTSPVVEKSRHLHSVPGHEIGN
ncbi:hypothetical protein MANES_15G096300v8 [Manihot esculenta]|uniref:Uncharacterized protein n=1 Tax=Manihot esculenta TaxID=3983 RepID=A0A2C9UFJ9_MANES|nr:hypothetical protein MANES_15G096300v8 [Manihot esculenta]